MMPITSKWMNKQMILTAERLECSEWRCIWFCSTKSLILKDHITSFLCGVSSLSIVFDFWFECVIVSWFDFVLLKFFCYSHYIQYHSWADSLFLYLFLALILSCLFPFPSSWDFVWFHLHWGWCHFFLDPWHCFCCRYLWLVLSLAFPSPPDSLYEFIYQNISSLLNLFPLLPNNPQFISHNLCCSSIQGLVHHPSHLAPHLGIVDGWILPLPCKIGLFQILSWCSSFLCWIFVRDLDLALCMINLTTMPMSHFFSLFIHVTVCDMKIYDFCLIVTTCDPTPWFGCHKCILHSYDSSLITTMLLICCNFWI